MIFTGILYAAGPGEPLGFILSHDSVPKPKAGALAEPGRLD